MPNQSPTDESIKQVEESLEHALETGEINSLNLDDPDISDGEGYDANPKRAKLEENIRIFSRYRRTVKATIFAILKALLVPCFLAFFVWQLWPSYDLSTLQGAICESAKMLVPALVLCFTLANLLGAGGAAERYYGWSPILCDGMMKTLNNLIWINFPLKFVYVALATYEGGVWNDSLGRILFVVSMMALSYALWQTSSSVNRWRDGLVDPRGWSAWIRRGSMLTMTLVPMVLAMMAAVGFYFTAVELSWRTVWTILLSFGIAVTTGLISRMLLITQFRIKLRQLERDSDGRIEDDETIDITEISTQVNRLLRATSLVLLAVVGWQIWAEVLPAIGYLDHWQLWHSAFEVDGVKSWITLKHLLMAVGLVFITFILSRNLPGLMEITFLDRLPLDKGGRYAISFVLRYLVGMAGFLFALQMVGFSWNKVQWLAAGLTVGLGFGLQEIFANLISGIIILIERPVRVGDLVTVNGVTGTVTQMQLRATTLKDRDYREYIVPNKRFITEDVMNWTLTDHLSKLILPIGIAYGSDTDKAQKVLLKVAKSHPFVLNDPEPEVTFVSFGASTLDFQLRAVIPNRDKFLKVTHQLNMEIDRAFREAGIEIAFPQQDIHLKGVEGLLPGRGPDGEPTGERKEATSIPANLQEPPVDMLGGGAFAKQTRSVGDTFKQTKKQLAANADVDVQPVSSAPVLTTSIPSEPSQIAESIKPVESTVELKPEQVVSKPVGEVVPPPIEEQVEQRATKPVAQLDMEPLTQRVGEDAFVKRVGPVSETSPEPEVASAEQLVRKKVSEGVQLARKNSSQAVSDTSADVEVRKPRQVKVKNISIFDPDNMNSDLPTIRFTPKKDGGQKRAA